jgi:hypothetical protein
MKNQKWILASVAVCLVSGLLVWKQRPSAEMPADHADALEAAAMSKAYQEVKNLSDRLPDRPQSEADAATKSAVQAAKVSATTERVAFEYARELAEFTVMKRKVFLSDEERVQKAALFGNRRMIASLGDYLNRPMGNDVASIGEQGAVLDLLVDALQSKEGNEAAEAALKSVVLDTQIESDHLAVEERKNLAGVKAEVLYQWTALEPGRAKEIRTWLPGPVSEKIWANVTETQNRNQAESAVIGLDDI